ncbi:MAG TPA: hypothetical protein VM120_23120 [Bryobacteraceae bacterium]|nr:hypothetical protein [Bryobacteraceae bacterium]
MMTRRTALLAWLFTMPRATPMQKPDVKGQAKLLSWQTNWTLYVSELTKRLHQVTAPLLYLDEGFKTAFIGKSIEFDGVLAKVPQGRPDANILLQMDPQPLAIPVWMFSPGADRAKTVSVTATELQLSIDPSASDRWKSIQPGTRVRFSATLDERPILLGTTTAGGVVFLRATLAVPRPALAK